MHKHITKVVSLVMALMMVISLCTVAAAATTWSDNGGNVVYNDATFGTNGYYNVISNKTWTLVPGAATETELVLNNSNGSRRQVLHVLECDPSNPDISIIPGYYNIDKDISNNDNWVAAGMTDMTAKYENELGYNVVCGMNTALAYDNNAPYSYLVYNGEVLVDRNNSINNFHSGGCQTLLCVYKDAETGACSCELRTAAQGLRGDEWQAIGANFAMTVNNGELVTKTEERTTSAAARSMIGVKEDGTLVLVMNDGRGANNSIGFCTYELGESMLALGCKWAFNCDGGGSSGFVTKRAGEDTNTMRSVPCDGAERPTINGIFIVSNVAPTGVLNNVDITSDYDYFAPGTSYTFGADAIDTHGYAMDMPADAAWQLSDTSFGSINNGAFTSGGTLGDVDVQVTSANTDVTDRTVIFSNNKNWNTVNIYYWSDDNDKMVDWPGTAMTEYDQNEYGEKRYSFELPAGATKFIINNGTDQTSNIDFTGKTGIYLDDNNAVQTYDISRKVVGSKTIHIANPTTLNLSSTETTLPYSTAAKVRTLTLPIVAKIGEANVYTDGSTYSTAITPAGSGSINGLTFTATEDTSISVSTITLTYLPTNTEMTYTVNYGKGSEIVFDFENNDRNGLVGFAEARKYFDDNEVPVENQFNKLISGGQIDISCGSETFIASKENGGQVHNGDYALGVNYDFRNTTFNSWVYAILYKISAPTVLKDTVNGENATGIGAWVYVPKGFSNPDGDTAGSLSMQFSIYVGNRDAETGELTMAGSTELNMQYNGKNLNALKEADIPENRWVYVKATLPTNYNYASTCDPTQPLLGRCPSFIRMYIKPTRAQMLTYYFDDFTLDYSSAVDDRNPPVISNATYCTNDTNIEFADQTIDTNVVSFDASIADYAASNAEGLDYSSAKIYVDGVAQSGVRASGSSMGIQNVVLSNGLHKITFEIADKLGNATTLTKSITVNAAAAKSGVTIVGHNDKGNVPEYDSVYYIDVKAAAAEDIDTINTTLYLNTANKWELDHITTPAGVTVDYDVNKVEPNKVILTITNDSALTGEQILASIPVRVWSYDESTIRDINDSTLTKAEKFATSYLPKVNVTANVLVGDITYTDDSKGTFNGTVDVATMLMAANNPWHDHDAELTVQNKEASCTEEGYENRTYCETCGSVVDWGTTVPAKSHSYVLTEGQFVCSDCEDVLDTTGFNGTREIGGELYFFIAGNLVSGWQTEGTDSYYFDPTTFAAVDGAQTIDGLDYVFTDKVLTKGAWKVTEEGRAYYWAGKPKHAEWAEIEGETYHFNAAGIAATGYQPIAQGKKYTLYHFTETGALIETIEQENGIFFTPEDAKEIYYFKDGYLFVAGLVEYNYEYYYFPSSFRAMRNSSRYIDAQGAHGYVPEGYYSFDDDCHIIYDFKNGVQEDGTVYRNGIKLKAYQLYNDGDDWYFIAENNRIAKDAKRYLNAAVVEGTDFAVGYYIFDEDGKMVDLNGPDENDYFYIHNEKQKAYKLCEYKGAWYLVAEYNKIARDQKRYLNASVVEGTPFEVGYYYFDADGKYTAMNGPQADGYFYVNDVKQTAYSLHLYEGNYYFVVEYNKYAKDARRYLTAENLEGTGYSPGYYNFDEDGKMIVKDGPWTDGYFYNHNVQVKAYKVVEFDGNYYFVAENNKYVKSVTRNITAEMAGDLIPAGKYEFDADGKMVYRQGPNADGYFYRENQKVKAYELCEYNGDYYLVAENNKYVKSATRKIQAAWLKTDEVSGIAPGSYEFDADGKMILPD